MKENNEVTGAVEFTEQELTAIGLALVAFRAEHRGMGILQALSFAMTMDSVDAGVMMALIDRAIVKMSEVEDHVFGKTNGILEDERLRDARATMRSELDQAFATFAEQGRTLFREEDDE